MKTPNNNATIAAVMILLLIGGIGCAAAAEQRSADGASASAERVLVGWPQTPQKVAKEMMSKYGAPDGVTPTRLIWHNKAPWNEIIVYKEEVEHHFPVKHTDVLEQVIYYKVPPDKLNELAQYDGSVIVERTKGTLAARCDKEAANFLALNLAHDIITGKRSVEDARQFYAETIKAMLKGEKPPYMQKLMFEPQSKSEAADPDKALIQK